MMMTTRPKEWDGEKPTHIKITDPIGDVEEMRKFGVIIEDQLLAYSEQSYKGVEPETSLYLKVSLPKELAFVMKWCEKHGMRLYIMKKSALLDADDTTNTNNNNNNGKPLALIYNNWMITMIIDDVCVYERRGGGNFTTIGYNQFMEKYLVAKKEVKKRKVVK
jgi:hypothetical protein